MTFFVLSGCNTYGSLFGMTLGPVQGLSKHEMQVHFYTRPCDRDQEHHKPSAESTPSINVVQLKVLVSTLLKDLKVVKRSSEVTHPA